MTIDDMSARIRELIDQITDQHPQGYVATDVAAKVLVQVRGEDPEGFTQWLDALAVDTLRTIVLRRGAVRRSSVRTSRSVFGSAVQNAEETGNSHYLHSWLTTPFECENHVQKPLGRMDAGDLGDAAGRYRARERNNRLTAMFLEALAKRVGAGMVEDHFTAEQLDTMWASIF